MIDQIDWNFVFFLIWPLIIVGLLYAFARSLPAQDRLFDRLAGRKSKPSSATSKSDTPSSHSADVPVAVITYAALSDTSSTDGGSSSDGGGGGE